jgi:MFS transporter, PPP family, 3-phenylpropionic acid transporter
VSLPIVPHLALRISTFYISIFFVIGSMMPFWPVWLQVRGMNGVEIGILTALPVLSKLVFSPLFASFGDRLGERKRLMILFLILSLIIFSGFAFVESFYGLFAISFLYGMCWAPLMSFGDNITLLSIRGTSMQYGRLRLWGSLSFIVMSFGLGWFLESSGADLIYWVILSSIAFTLLATLGLPDVRITALGRKGRPVSRLLKDRTFLIFLGSVTLVQGSHALYYAFATLHWRSLGYSDGLIGFLWAEAVCVEVLFFIFGGRIGNRFSAESFLILAGSAAIIRWSVLAYDPDMVVLFSVQSLHALTFGAMHLGAMAFITRSVPLDLSATAQSLYGASAYGIGTGITMLFVGALYEEYHAYAFFLMTLMALGGTLFGLVLRRREKSILPS